LDWSCTQVPARARNPPTRGAREAMELQANGVRVQGQFLCRDPQRKLAILWCACRPSAEAAEAPRTSSSTYTPGLSACGRPVSGCLPQVERVRSFACVQPCAATLSRRSP